MAEKYNVKRTSDPAVEPVTVGQLKDHLRIATNLDDTVLAHVISSARAQVERDTGQSLITQTWQMTLDKFPTENNPIKLFHGPVQSVSAFTYNDSAGSSVTYSDYQLKTNDNPALIFPNVGTAWPSGYYPDKRGISITYTAGHGNTHMDIPAELRHAVILRCCMFYDGENKWLNSAYERISSSNSRGVY